MADDNNPQVQTLAKQDETFRQTMRDKQSQDPQAEKWVNLDNQAADLQQDVQGAKQEKAQRPQRGEDAYKALADARGERDDFQKANPDADNYAGGKEKWNQEIGSLDKTVSDRQADFGVALKNSTPDQLQNLQDQIDQKREALTKTIEERQGIAKLPSESGQNQEDQQSQERGANEIQEVGVGNYGAQGSMADRLNNRRAQQGQTQDDSGAVGRRLRPNFSAYATSLDEHNADKQLEQDQATLRRELGRPATNEEMQKFESDRAASQKPADQAQGEDLHAQATAGSMSERLATQRAQKAPAQTQDDAEQKDVAQAKNEVQTHTRNWAAEDGAGMGM